jgi:peptide/nickel transport system ATP-binding protein
VVKHFPVKGRRFFHGKDVLRAVDDVSMKVFEGETVGLVGESGCGKSTLARLIVRLHDLTAGEIWFEGQEIGHMSSADIRPFRRRMQLVFQDPYASLNPRMTVNSIIGEPLRFHNITRNDKDTDERVQELLALVGLNPRHAGQYPHQFSGGQRQRIGFARALAVAPNLILADEPISSLDVNIQAQIINLLVDLQERLDLTYVFISHNLSVVRHLADRIVVLYLGKVAEIVSNKVLFDDPLHPYTQSLISAVPIADVRIERERERIIPTGEAPSPVHPPSGCRFRTRCPIAKPICAEQEPAVAEHRSDHWVACHFPGGL